MDAPLAEPLLRATTDGDDLRDHAHLRVPSQASQVASSPVSSPSDGSDRHPQFRRSKTLAGADKAAEAAHKLAGRVKERLHDRLHDAQAHLLQQTEGRHAIYSVQTTASEKRSSVLVEKKEQQRSSPATAVETAPTSTTTATTAQPLTMPVPTRPSRPIKRRASDYLKRPRRPSWMGVSAIGIKKASRCRAHSDVDQAARMARWGANIQQQLAYMGIDWYQIQERQRRLSWLFFIENLYFWCYAGYIVSAILIGAVLIWALEPNGQLSFTQSVYSAAACVSQSGLAVVDWSKQAQSTYVISFLLILCGSASLLHMAPVLLRRKSFRMQTLVTQRLQEKLEQHLPEAAAAASTPPRTVRLRRTNSDPCIYDDSPDKVDEPPAPRQTRKTLAPSAFLSISGPRAKGAFPVVDDSPFERMTSPVSLGESALGEGSRRASPPRVHSSNLGSENGGPQRSVSYPRNARADKRKHITDSLSERHRLEYKALGKVLKIMVGYWLAVHFLGWLVFFLYFKLGNGPIQEKFHREGLRSDWHAAYLTASSFQNNGLVMTPSSVMDFRWSPLLLNTIGALILCGNTMLPIAVRAIAWWLSRHAAPNSEQQRVWDFLLEHPRRCFTHMFPAVHTLWLLLVMSTLIGLQTLVMLWQDSEDPEGKAFSWWDEDMQMERQLGSWDRFWNCLFNAISTRTAGMNSINVADLSQGTTFLMVVLMYFSTTPTVVTMRHSAAAAGGCGELDITGRAEGVDEEVLLGENSLKSQARRYLTQDITYLVFILFLICVFEKNNFAISAKEITPDSDGIYGDFSFFKVLFELASAYGTCGFSLGFRNQTSSFSGMWSPPSQYLLVVVMVLGRLRGLPDSIDPSVKVAMESGEHTEHAFLHA